MLGFTPGNFSFYRLAFMHKSGLENIHQQSNERLEFLGDAVLSLLIAENIYHKFPEKDEGYLTKLRSKISSREFLNNLGYEMEIDTLITLNKGVHRDAEIVDSMVGNALEAFFGAIFLDKGYAKTKVFFEKIVLIKYIDFEEAVTTETNHKSALLEWGQKHSKTISFVLTHTQHFKDHDLYTISVKIDGETHGTAKANRKKRAEQEAAKITLEKLD
ncbi:MAG: ribonuclease III [Bacteroidetes bacterium]|nr:ribonuclease III [Bacteroidota bacterium]